MGGIRLDGLNFARRGKKFLDNQIRRKLQRELDEYYLATMNYTHLKSMEGVRHNVSLQLFKSGAALSNVNDLPSLAVVALMNSFFYARE